MLVLTREKEEAIMIGNQIEVKVLEIKGDRVRLGIIAPPEVPIHRMEVYLAIKKANLEAAESKSEGVDEVVRILKNKEK
ncbi:MAG: carbon storage regulator CsrA [Planctomycetes bacterium]|nr:carbon storage regulator CsrA [Planctomycetota bacterium]